MLKFAQKVRLRYISDMHASQNSIIIDHEATSRSLEYHFDNYLSFFSTYASFSTYVFFSQFGDLGEFVLVQKSPNWPLLMKKAPI